MNKALLPIAVALLLCAATTRAQDHQLYSNLTVYPQKIINLLPIAFSIGYKVAID